MNGASVPVLADPAPSAPPRLGAWGDFAPRLVSALVLLPLALVCAWLGGLGWTCLLLAAAATLLFEWHGMGRAGRLGPPAMLLGAAYIALACASLIWLRASPATGLDDVLFLLCCVWSTDVGAYLVGRWVGGPRLAPAVSPGKTWSGAAGGVLAAIAAALALSARLPHGAPAAAALLAVILSVATQLGDLLESAAKRRCGVKDAGRLIPGHGGLLDRVDGILCAAPVMAALGSVFGRGIVFWN